MKKQAEHMFFAKFVGVANLSSSEAGLDLQGLSVRFDARTLAFEVDLPLNQDWRNVFSEDPPKDISLCNLVLEQETSGERIAQEGKLTGLQVRNPRTDFEDQEGAPLEHAPFALRIGLSRPCVTFQRVAPASMESQCVGYYQHIGNDWLLPSPIKLPNGEVIFFEKEITTDDFMGQQVWRLSSHTCFAGYPKRLIAALALAYGSLIRLVLQVTPQEITFYGFRSGQAGQGYGVVAPTNYRSDELLNAILAGCFKLSSEDFLHADIAMRLHMYAKQAEMPEFGFLQAMICVEAMDGERKSTLCDSTTAALLGVSTNAARLFNGMRHKLVHGRGGHRKAFEEVKKDKFKGTIPPLEPPLQACLNSDDPEGRFTLLYWRLCERLDAFWCAYLTVPKDLVALRRARVALMPAVNLEDLESAISSLQANLKHGESREIENLNETIQRLKNRCEHHKDKLRQQIEGLRTAKEKVEAELALYKKAGDTNPVQHEFRVDCQI